MRSVECNDPLYYEIRLRKTTHAPSAGANRDVDTADILNTAVEVSVGRNDSEMKLGFSIKNVSQMYVT